MTLCLSYDELVEYTHLKRHSAQKRALDRMGIQARVRPDGSLAVLRDNLEVRNEMRPRRRIEPNWEAVR